MGVLETPNCLEYTNENSSITFKWHLLDLNSSTTPSLLAFQSYLKRRNMSQRSQAYCINAKRIQFLTSPEKWFIYRLVTGTLEVTDEIFKDERNLCFFCKEMPETTDHIMWECVQLHLTYMGIIQLIEERHGKRLGRIDFLTTSKNAKIDAMITKVLTIDN
nr:uncharacterized protein LOC121124529 isoform X2 [Lepeophtheirus salmonis]